MIIDFGATSSRFFDVHFRAATGASFSRPHTVDRARDPDG
jgi:hypothetical protein